MSDRSDPDLTRPALVAAELGVLAVGLGTAAACARLFLGWGFLATLSLSVGTSWALAVLTRRTRLGVTASAAITAVAAILVLSWVFAPATTMAGIPTLSTAEAIADAMRASFTDFSRLVAPVEASDGFLVVLAAVLWAFTWFADSAALRYGGPVQAVIPYGSAFIAVGVLSRDSGRTGAAAMFGIGIAIYAVTQRALTASRWNWPERLALRGTGAVVASATAIVGGALVAGLLVGPLLPGDTEAVVDLRSMGRRGGTRTVVSPFVGIRALLGPQSDQVVFTVRSPVPSYWRLTALGRYDVGRDIWVSQGTYGETADGRLDPDAGDRPSRPTSDGLIDQEYEILGLGGPWVPAAFVPRSIDGDIEVSFDPATSSIITRGDDLAAGDRFQIASDIPAITTTDLNASRMDDDLAARYLDTSGVSGSVAAAARRATLGRTTPYQQALALQDWFRDEFTYETDVDYRSDADPVAAFLDRREGFCQQFASAYALMARSLGLPARVAVGFTQGDAVDGTDGSTTYVVRGRHAHTWPEVHFDGVGWVPFEPTTGRGNPQAVDYTGVEPDQAEAPAAEATTTTTTTSTTLPIDADTATTVPSGQVNAVGARGNDATDDGGSSWWRQSILLAVTLAAVSMALLALGRRRRRSALRRDAHGGRIAAAWAGALTDLSTIGIVPTPSETPLELADRVAAVPLLDGAAPTGDDDRPDDVDPRILVSAFRLLATLETARRWAPRRTEHDPVANNGHPDDPEQRAAEDAADQVHRVVGSMSSRHRRSRQSASAGARASA